jgi:hypothetical protein
MTDIPADPANGEERVWFYTHAGATIFMNATGGLGIDVGGHVIIKPVREWHRLAGGGGSILDRPASEFAPPVPEMSPCCRASLKRSGQGLS